MNFITINKNTEEGFQDLEFNITEYWNEQGYNVIKAFGQFEGNVVGLIIAFQEDMISGINENGEITDDAFYRDGVLFYSVGYESNNLIDAMSKLYEVKHRTREMNDIIPFTCFVLGGKPSNFKHEIIKYKLFFDENDEWGLYSELYLNIDLQRGFIELKEKDDEYRVNIIKALTYQN